jgi:hypothetical protein
MKPLKTILEEHRQAMAEIEKARAKKAQADKERANAAEKERAKAQEAWHAQTKKVQEEAAAFRAEAVKLYSQIEAWVKDEEGFVFEKDTNQGTARLTLDKTRILFQPAPGGPKHVQVGVDLSTVPWSNLQSIVGHLALHEGVWYWQRQTSIQQLDQSQFNEVLESCLNTARNA